MIERRIFWRVARGGKPECRPASFRVVGSAFWRGSCGKHLTAMRADGYGDSPEEAWEMHIRGVEARLQADQRELKSLTRSIPKSRERLEKLRALAAADAEKAQELTLR